MGSEKGSGGGGSEGGSEDAAGGGVASVRVSWRVALREFQAGQAAVFRSPFAGTVCPGGLLTRSWQLVISHPEDTAVVAVVHKSPGMPLPPLSYQTYLQRKDGTQAPLKQDLLQKLSHPEAQSNRSLQPFISDDQDVDVRAEVSLQRCHCHPVSVLLAAIEQEEQKAANRPGEVGERLWQQTLSGQTDVRFLCADGEIIHAHRSLLLSFAPGLEEQLAARGADEASETLVELGRFKAAALHQTLYFLYHRRASVDLGKVHLGHVLALASFFQGTELLRLEVERLLVLVLREDNLLGLAHLAHRHRLPVLANVIHTVVHNTVPLRSELAALLPAFTLSSLPA